MAARQRLRTPRNGGLTDAVLYSVEVCWISQEPCAASGLGVAERVYPQWLMAKDGKDYKWLAQASMASTATTVLVVAPAIGFFFGSWLDRKLGSEPWAMIVFTLLGVASGFYEMVRIVVRLSK